MVVASERLRTTEVLTAPRILRLDEAGFAHQRNRLAELYYRGWADMGLCPSREEAARRIDHCLPEHTIVVWDDERQEIFGVLNTAPARVANLLELGERFPTYRSVEAAGGERGVPLQANCRVCYSVVVPHGLRLQQPQPGMTSSAVAEFLLKAAAVPGQRTIAYSRFGRVPAGRSLSDHYKTSQGNVVDSGAVGLHERFGGLTVALIEGSRPEDVAGGGGNVLVAYPMSPEEEIRFAEIRQRRRQGSVGMEQHGAITLLEDSKDLRLFETLL